MPEPPWLENPSVLISSFVLVPRRTMTDAEVLNTMTRVILVVSLFMFILGLNWLLFLIMGLVAVVVVWWFMKSDYENDDHHSWPNTDLNDIAIGDERNDLSTIED